MPVKVVRSGEAPDEDALDRARRSSDDRARKLADALDRGIRVDVERVADAREAIRDHRRDAQRRLRECVGGVNPIDEDDLQELPDAVVDESW